MDQNLLNIASEINRNSDLLATLIEEQRKANVLAALQMVQDGIGVNYTTTVKAKTVAKEVIESAVKEMEKKGSLQKGRSGLNL